MHNAKKLLLTAIIVLSGSPQCQALSITGSVGKKLMPQALKKGNFGLAKLFFSLIDPTQLPIKGWREPLLDGNLLMHQILRKAVDNKRYYQCIKLFQEKVDPHCCFDGPFYRKDIQGKYPIDIAFEKKLSKIAIFLINLDQYNCWFNKRNDDYMLLHYAVEYGLFEVITYLMKDFGSQRGRPGCLTNAQSQDSYGWTALHYASAKGDYNMFNFLLTLGCKADIKNDDGKTALELWPENYQKYYYKRLVDRVRMYTKVSHCSTEDRYLYLKNLETSAKKDPKPDIKIIFKK